jgi:hypothetical protein
MSFTDDLSSAEWGLGPVTDAGMDFVSVRWQGKVKPQFAEVHTFYVSSDDGAKLWVDNVVMIGDGWPSPACSAPLCSLIEANMSISRRAC